MTSLASDERTLKSRVKRKKLIWIGSGVTVFLAALGIFLGLYLSGGRERYNASTQADGFITNTFVSRQLNTLQEANCTALGWTDVKAIYDAMRLADASNVMPRYEGSFNVAVSDYQRGVRYQYYFSDFTPGTGAFASWKQSLTILMSNNLFDGVQYQ